MIFPVCAIAGNTGSLVDGELLGNVTALAKRGVLEPPAIPVQNACKLEDTVALDTGEFTWSMEDLVLPTRGPDLVVAHTYKSGSNIRGRWGRGWHLSVDIRVARLENGNLLLVTGAGQKHEFIKNVQEDGTISYLPPAGVYDELVETENGGVACIAQTGLRHEFDSEGKLISMLDRNGNALTFTYADPSEASMSVKGTSEFFTTQEGSGLLAWAPQLISIIDSSGMDSRKIDFVYYDDGKLKSVSGPGDREMNYEYDANGRLTRIVLPPLLDAEDAVRDAYVFGYEDGRLTTVTDPEGLILVQNVYDDQGRIKEQTNRGRKFLFAYNEEGNATTVTRPNGAVDEYVFNDQGNPTSVIMDKGEGKLNLETVYEFDDRMNMTKIIDPKGDQTSYDYDDAGRLKTVTRKSGNEELLISTYYYENGRLSRIVEPLNKETAFSYDDNGNVKEIAYPSGQKLAFEYDAETETAGDLTKIIEYATDGQDIATVFSYDDLGYLKQIKDRMRATADLAYNEAGYLESFTNRDGAVLLYAYDNWGRLAATNLRLAADSEKLLESFEYFKNSKLKKITHPGDESVSYQYDDHGRLDKISPSSRPETEFAYNDVSGNLKEVHYADQPVMSFGYDALNRLTVLEYPIEGVEPRPSIHYDYYVNGNLERFVDAEGKITQFEYDAFGNLIKITYHDGSKETRTYDDLGKVATGTDRSENSISYDYFENSRRLKAINFKDQSIQYKYGNTGLLDSVTTKDEGGQDIVAFVYGHDQLGRLISVEQTIGQDRYDVDYEYSPEGKPKKLEYPGGLYAIDYVYDDHGRLDMINGASTVVSFDYDDAGHLALKKLGNGLQQKYIRNDAGQIKKIELLRAPYDAAFSSIVYDYDDFGNVKTETNIPLGDFGYDYDALNRLVSADYPENLELIDAAFAYDWAGNRKTITTDAEVAYSLIDNSNCYSQVGETELGCDNNGNLAKDATNQYHYNQQNRLIQVDVGEAIEIFYTYDHEGRLIRRQSGVVEVVSYVYDADRIIAEYDQEGNLLRRYVYHPETGDLIRMTVIGLGDYYFLMDLNGSVMGVADESGNVVERYAYDAFGRFVIQDANDQSVQVSSVGNPYYFKGMRFDSTTGLYIDGCRHYHPGLGRYLQPDPKGYDILGNPYTYMNNNPFNKETLPLPTSVPDPEAAPSVRTLIQSLLSDPFVADDPALPRPMPALQIPDPNTSNLWTPPDAGTTIPDMIQTPFSGR